MEGPAAVLAAVELAVLVDGVIDQVKRRPLSAFGADNAVTFSFFFRHHAWCFYCFCGFDFKYKWWRHILTDCRHQHFLITNATITIVDLFQNKTNIPEGD